MVVRCCVSGCKTKGTSGFHSFPAKWNIRQEWIRRTKAFHLNKDKIVRSWSKVCGRHFIDQNYTTNFRGKKRLKPKVVPSQYLPDLIDHNYNGCDSQVS